MIACWNVVVCLAILVAFWRIATKRENIAYPCLGVTLEDAGDLRLRLADAGEVGDRHPSDVVRLMRTTRSLVSSRV